MSSFRQSFKSFALSRWQFCILLLIGVIHFVLAAVQAYPRSEVVVNTVSNTVLLGSFFVLVLVVMSFFLGQAPSNKWLVFQAFVFLTALVIGVVNTDFLDRITLLLNMAAGSDEALSFYRNVFGFLASDYVTNVETGRLAALWFVALFYAFNAIPFLFSGGPLPASLQRPKRESDQQKVLLQDIDTLLPRASKEKKLVVEMLRQSILETKQRASRVLSVIMILLFAGVLVILFAGRITSLDATAGVVTSKIEEEKSTLTETRKDLVAQMSELGAQQVRRTVILSSLGIPIVYSAEDSRSIFVEHSALEEFKKRLGQEYTNDPFTSDSESLAFDTTKIEDVARYYPRLAEVLVYQRATVAQNPVTPASGKQLQDDVIPNIIAPALQPTLSALRQQAFDFIDITVTNVGRDNFFLEDYKSEIDDIDERIVKINVLIDKEVGAGIDAMINAGNQSSSFLIASGITRFGIVAIIVFIIQIRVTLYRYNMRLASFYSSRLSALVYGENETGTVEFFSNFFDTKEITFGKDIVSPTQSVNELVKSAIEQAGKAWAAKTS